MPPRRQTAAAAPAAADGSGRRLRLAITPLGRPAVGASTLLAVILSSPGKDVA
jgi:hypothetical protein